MLHDETVWKAVSMDESQKKLTKHLQFTQSAHRRQSAKCMDSYSYRLSSGKSSFLSSPKTSSSSSKCGKRKKFQRFLGLLSATDKRHSRKVLAFLAFLRSRGMDSSSSLLSVHCPLLPPPTCVVGACRVHFIRYFKEKWIRYCRKATWK